MMTEYIFIVLSERNLTFEAGRSKPGHNLDIISSDNAPWSDLRQAII